jgi:hypothetical protein
MFKSTILLAALAIGGTASAQTVTPTDNGGAVASTPGGGTMSPSTVPADPGTLSTGGSITPDLPPGAQSQVTPSTQGKTQAMNKRDKKKSGKSHDMSGSNPGTAEPGEGNAAKGAGDAGSPAGGVSGSGGTTGGR